MIHIDDIKERYARNPEPKEVTEARELILNSFNKLEFVEDGHKYFLPDKDGGKIEVSSVSKFIENFEIQEDWDEIAENYSLRHDIPLPTVKRMWRENNLRATNNGTSVHLYGEWLLNMFIGKMDFDPVIKPQYEGGFLIPYGPKQEAIEKYWTDILFNNDIYPVLSETRVYTGMNDKYSFKKHYAGTFDILLAYRMHGKIVFAVQDFKTNSSLTNNYQRAFKKKMLPPFEDMYDEALGHYTVQLSAYQLALSQLDLPIVDRRLIHVKDDGTYDKVALPDVTQKIKEYCES